MAADVFLTGATGYAGPAVLKALKQSGRSVTALVRDPQDIDGARTVVGDLASIRDVAADVAAADAVVHLASGRTLDRERVVYEDILGTGELLDAWTHGPFVISSTTTVHGVPHGVLSDASGIDIGDWYDAGKAVNEFQVRDAVAAGVNGRGPGIALRPTLYFGRSQGPPKRQYLDSYFRHAVAGHAFTFDSEEAAATTGAAYIGVDDFGSAVVAALDKPRSGGYPIASGFVTWRDLVNAINRAAGTNARCVVRPNGPQSPDEFRVGHSRTELDSSAFAAAFEWQPRQGLDELVDAFVRGEREAGRA